MAPELLLDVKLLRLLDQLHSTRSVTRAAEALGQSQPTVSIWLAQLRKQLDDPLVVRTPQGMMPTPRTDALIGTVREVLAGLERLGEAAAPFDPSGTRRRFRICMTDASHVTLRVAADDRGREQHGASPRFLGARKPFIAKANSNDRKSQPGSLTITSFVDASRGEWARYRHARAVRRKP